jgi:integrase
MSVRRVKRRDPKTGAERQFWIVDVVFEHADGRVQRARKVSPVQTKRGAEEYERQLRAALLSPVRKKEAPTLEAFSTRWIESDAQATNRASTVAEKRGQLRKHIVPHFGRMHLDAIGTESIASFYAHLRKQDLSLKTVQNLGGVLHRMLAAAVEWEVIEKLPRFPRLKVPSLSQWDFFTRDEVTQLLRVVGDPFERALLVFAFDTGARSGEQIAITWGDIDWFNNHVVFRRASSRGVVGPTKDGEERRVPMTPRLAEALKAIRHLKGDLVFTQPDGEPLDPWRLRRLLDRVCRRAGLRRIRRHDCRHSFASQLVTSGVPLPQVQAWLGHSTIHMTMRYAHLAPNSGADLIRSLDPSCLRQPDGNSGRVAS